MLKVGITASLSGQFRLQGTQALQGAKLWVEEVNRRGGLFSPETAGLSPVELVYYDDESSPKVAQRLTSRLLTQDGVDILLGPYSSALTLAAAPVAEEHEVVLWNHGGATDVLYEKGFKWIVGVLSPASRYFHGVLDMIHHLDESAVRLALLWSGRGSFGAQVAAGAKSHATRLGLQVVLEQPWELPLQASLLQLLEQCEPDIILGAGAFEDDVILAQGLLQHSIGAKAIGLVAAGVAEFGKRLGALASAFLGPSQWEPTAAGCMSDSISEKSSKPVPYYGPSPEEFMRLLQASNIQSADYPAAQAFAAGLVIQKCVEAVGAGSKPSPTYHHHLRDAAAKLEFTTFYGRFRIDPSTGRQLGHLPLVVQWHGTEKKVVWPKQSQQAEPIYPFR